MGRIPKKFLRNWMLFRELGEHTLVGAGSITKPDASGDIHNTASQHLNAVYVLRGRGTYTCETCGRMELQAGDVFFRFPGLVHNTCHVPDGKWVEAFLTLTPNLSQVLEDTGILQRSMPVIHPGLDLALAETILQIGHRLASCPKEALFALALDAQRVVEELAHRAGKVAEETADVPWLAQAKRRLAENPGTRLSLRRLADDLGLGYESFRKIFTANEKISPGAYRIRCRIAEARRQLLNYQKQVKEVALGLGYSSPAAFSAQFLANTGMSPQQFRLQHELRQGGKPAKHTDDKLDNTAKP